MMIKNEGRLFELLRAGGDTPEEVRKNWLSIRAKGVGGSDVASIMGLSPWKGVYTLWAEKSGIVEPQDISGKESVAMGTELEGDVREMYKRRNPDAKVRVVNAVAQSIARPWALASVDGLTSDPELGVGILEIKTGGSEERWKDGVPIHYLCQVQHYMSVTGYPFADVAALVGDHGLHYHQFRVMRDEDDVAAIDGSVDSFWNDFVVAGKAPFARGIDSAALQSANPDDSGEVVDLGDNAEVERLVRSIDEANAAKKTADGAIKDAQARLKQLIGTDKGIAVPTATITWSRYERTSVDSKLLKRDFPDAYAACLRTSASSRLTIKEAK